MKEPVLSAILRRNIEQRTVALHPAREHAVADGIEIIGFAVDQFWCVLDIYRRNFERSAL